MSAPILFLDIDGVLNDNAWITAACAGQSAITSWSLDLARRCLDPARCARLQRVCGYTFASLVIVSGWRRWATVEGIGRWRGEGESHARIYARHAPALQPPSSPGKSTRENATKQGTMQNSDE